MTQWILIVLVWGAGGSGGFSPAPFATEQDCKNAQSVIEQNPGHNFFTKTYCVPQRGDQKP